MAPGAKKKGGGRKISDNFSDNKRGLKNTSGEKLSTDSSLHNQEFEIDNDAKKKYSKRGIESNWQKYEETVSDPHADVTRGKDIEVLMSYSTGSDALLKLQVEKEWEEESCEEKFTSVDLKDFVHVVKSIPFHKQINLSQTIFTPNQLSQFELSAEKWKNSYNSNLCNTNDKAAKVEDKIEFLDTNLNVIDSCERNDDQEESVIKSVMLEEKTESIIESLASCLSLKDSAPDKIKKANNEVVTENVSDDLDFLLSLNVSLKNPVKVEKENEIKTNVDDWLSSILDD